MNQVDNNSEDYENIDDLLDNFLSNEIETNKKEMWSKLNNKLKIKKIKDYSNELLKNEYELSNKEINDAITYFKSLLDKKIISKNNEVRYDKELQKIEKINYINFNNKTRKFFYKKEKNQTNTNTIKNSKSHKKKTDKKTDKKEIKIINEDGS